MTKNYKVYISYCGEDKINDFNLKESEHIKLWNINEDKGINKINCHYANLVNPYYIWKNQIKSDYVCIWDHRRLLKPINFDKLDNDMVQVYYHGWTDLTPFEYMIKDGINEYIILQFIKYMIEVKKIDHDLIIDKIYKQPWYNNIWFHNCFNCNWKVFNDLCEFMFGFMEYIIPNGKYENQKSCDEFIKDLQISCAKLEYNYRDDYLFTHWGRIKSGDRVFGSIYELLLPLYCDLVWNGTFHEENPLKIGMIYNDINDNSYDEIKKWISKNTFTGCRKFYIQTLEENYENLLNIINKNRYYLCSGNVDIIKNKFPQNTVILKLNEYIDDENNLNSISTW